MAARDRFEWPWFDAPHRDLAARVEAWAAQALPGDEPEPADVDAAVRRLVGDLGSNGWLRHCVPASHGGALADVECRALCIIREALAYRSALADFAFALEGLGSCAIAASGSAAQRDAYLPRVAAGSAVAAFALSEPGAGSDAAALTTSARRDGDHYVLDGVKTWTSNGGAADFYVLFARVGDAPGSKGITAFVIDRGTPGLEAEARIEVMAPHPLATMRLRGCRIPASARIGAEGDGFKVAMQTLDLFRPSVAAAALGFARRAFDEAVARARARQMFGKTLADLQLTQAAVGDMAALIDASALLVYRAAWLRDTSTRRTTEEAAIAKLFATEAAQKVIDRSVQIHGGLGVVRGNVVERLYRDIRALRIYEGATEVQQLIIGRHELAEPDGSKNR
jgi:acyl-CoA dehydrogenase